MAGSSFNTLRPPREPPWLSYRHMTPSMQKRFKTLAKDRGFWHNETTATHQDLAGLFVARAVERYLKSGGQLAFVVPNSVIDRDYWSGFRAGTFDGANVTFGPSWDLRRIRPHLFPRGSAVIFGRRGATAGQMPGHALVWTGRAPHRHSSIEQPLLLRQAVGELTISTEDDPKSPYAARFSQGANLVPRLLFRVAPAAVTGLGVPSGRASVRSKRSVSEKKPWKDLPDQTGTVETEFIWPTVLGEHLLPFRLTQPDDFVLPLTQSGEVLGGTSQKIDAYPGLADWVRRAEEQWSEHGESKLTLPGQIDHMRKLSQQVPPAAIRVAYPASGMHACAALVSDPRAIIEHGAYWAAVNSEAEGRYLVGILNAPILTELVRPYMSYGKDERHVDKHVWKLPIPLYEPENHLHAEIAKVAQDLTDEIARMEFRSSYFVTIRKDLRAHIQASEAGQRLDALVRELLDAEDADEQAAEPVGATRLIRTTTGPLGGLAADVVVDVDCEFDEEGRVYLWGALVSRGADHEYRAFGSGDANVDEYELAAEFAEWLTTLIAGEQAQGRSVRWFHYGWVEQRHLERLVPAAALEPLLEVAVDLLTDVVRPNFYAPGGYGLKRLAPGAGATWRTEGAEGSQTLDWIAAAREGDSKAWARLVEYNEDDTRATKLLREQLLEAETVGWGLP